MPGYARTRRRSLAPRVDSLEGRKLLSHWAHPVEAPAVVHRAEIADDDDARPAPQAQLLSDRSVSPMGLAPKAAGPAKEAAGPSRSELETYGSTWDERSNDDAEYSRGGSPAAETAEIVTPAATAMEPDSLDAGASDDPERQRSRSLERRPDSSLGFNLPGVGAALAGTVEPPPSVAGDDKGPSERTQPTKAESTPRPRHETEPDATSELDSEIESPRGAGLISQALPFSGEVLYRAVDELRDQFEDLGVLDAVADVVTGRFAAFGTACAATLGAIEAARRLHQKGPETKARRTPSGRMVPGLWPARS